MSTGPVGAGNAAKSADAGVAASRINLKLREMIASGKYGEMRATVGALTPNPGLVNIVPGRVEMTVDLRNPDDQAMTAAEAELLDFYSQLETEEHVKIQWRQTAKTPAAHFCPRLQGKISAAAQREGLSYRPIIAGAGHDAQEFANIGPAAMVFVPGEYDGISHNPREYSTMEQCARGINIMLAVALELADSLE